MITDYKVKVLRLNTPLRGKPEGSEIRIKVDKDGIPLEQYWRDRLKDADADNCVCFVGHRPKNKKKGSDDK